MRPGDPNPGGYPGDFGFGGYGAGRAAAQTPLALAQMILDTRARQSGTLTTLMEPNENAVYKLRFTEIDMRRPPELRR